MQNNELLCSFAASMLELMTRSDTIAVQRAGGDRRPRRRSHRRNSPISSTASTRSPRAGSGSTAPRERRRPNSPTSSPHGQIAVATRRGPDRSAACTSTTSPPTRASSGCSSRPSSTAAPVSAGPSSSSPSDPRPRAWPARDAARAARPARPGGIRARSSSRSWYGRRGYRVIRTTDRRRDPSRTSHRCSPPLRPTRSTRSRCRPTGADPRVNGATADGDVGVGLLLLAPDGSIERANPAADTDLAGGARRRRRRGQGGPTQRVAQRLPTAEIGAAACFVSRLRPSRMTARAICDEVGSVMRGELVARLYFDQDAPRPGRRPCGAPAPPSPRLPVAALAPRGGRVEPPPSVTFSTLTGWIARPVLSIPKEPRPSMARRLALLATLASLVLPAVAGAATPVRFFAGDAGRRSERGHPVARRPRRRARRDGRAGLRQARRRGRPRLRLAAGQRRLPGARAGRRRAGRRRLAAGGGRFGRRAARRRLRERRRDLHRRAPGGGAGLCRPAADRRRRLRSRGGDVDQRRGLPRL